MSEDTTSKLHERMRHMIGCPRRLNSEVKCICSREHAQTWDAKSFKEWEGSGRQDVRCHTCGLRSSRPSTNWKPSLWIELCTRCLIARRARSSS